MAKRSPSIFWLFLLWICLIGGFLAYRYPKEFRRLGHKVYTLIFPKPTRQRHHNLRSFGTKIPANYATHGLDVSHYQDDIDWKELSTMRINGINLQFVFIKATEGNTYKDSFFANNWQSAKEANLIRGAYHFYRPDADWETQANNFIQTINLESGDLPPVLDIESLGENTPEELRENLQKWLNKVSQTAGIQPIIYTNYSFYQDYLKKHFKKYRFWIAHYQTRKLQLKDADWAFWQHTDKGTVNGIVGFADLNVFNGSMTDLQKLCKK